MPDHVEFRRTLVRVLAVQVVTLLVLGWLQWTYGR
jgi:hypothetical protein